MKRTGPSMLVQIDLDGLEHAPDSSFSPDGYWSCKYLCFGALNVNLELIQLLFIDYREIDLNKTKLQFAFIYK